jgi:tetratricopeptide (TPR) repeat protein
MKRQQLKIIAALAAGGLAVALSFAPEVVFALPVYAQKEGKPCGYCHVNQASGGALTPNGRSYQADNHTFKVPPVRTSTQSSVTTEAGSASDAQSHAQRALGLFNRGSYGGAFVEYSAAISLAPSNAAMIHNRGLASSKLGRYDTAFADFSNAILLEPNNAWFYNARGGISLIRQNLQAAAADFRKALSLDPTNPVFYENLRRTLNSRPLSPPVQPQQVQRQQVPAQRGLTCHTTTTPPMFGGFGLPTMSDTTCD